LHGLQCVCGGFITEIEKGLHVTEGDAVSLYEEGFFNGGSVDPGAIAGAEVLQGPALIRGSQLGVLAGDGWTIQKQDTLRMAADGGDAVFREGQEVGRFVFRVDYKRCHGCFESMGLGE
jgi:hypothetical protein